jgi:polysaccharide pyruvyl transferase WcaK-like protein
MAIRPRMTVLIVNAYSVRNRGDAAIVRGLIATLRQLGTDRIAVAPRGWGQDTEEWLALGADSVVAPLLSIHDAPAWARTRRVLLLAHVIGRIARSLAARVAPPLADDSMRAYARAGVVVSAGGAYLGGRKPGVNLVRGYNIAYGRIWGRPTIAAPMTINPPSRVVRPLLRNLLRGVPIFARDHETIDRATELGLTATFAPDLVFRAARTRAPHQPSGIVAWAPRGYRPDQDAWAARDRLEANQVAAVTDLLRTDAALRLEFVPQVDVEDIDDDRVTIARLERQLWPEFDGRVSVLTPPASIEDTIDAYGRYDAVLTSRLHAALLALLSGTPSLVVGYEPKVSGVLATLGLDDRVIPPDGSWGAAEIASGLRRLMRDPGELDATRAATRDVEAQYASFDDLLRRKLAQ